MVIVTAAAIAGCATAFAYASSYAVCDYFYTGRYRDELENTVNEAKGHCQNAVSRACKGLSDDEIIEVRGATDVALEKLQDIVESGTLYDKINEHGHISPAHVNQAFDNNYFEILETVRDEYPNFDREQFKALEEVMDHGLDAATKDFNADNKPTVTVSAPALG